MIFCENIVRNFSTKWNFIKKIFGEGWIIYEQTRIKKCN